MKKLKRLMTSIAFHLETVMKILSPPKSDACILGKFSNPTKKKTVLLYGKDGRSFDLKETRFDIYNSFSLKFSIVAKTERKIRKENS